jgi:hypothetical protein
MKLATQNRDEWRMSRDRKTFAVRRGFSRRPSPVTRHDSAFTLAEVLAAMLFLAIVIPAAVEAMHIASLAGEVGARKGAAARIADRVLNEALVTTNWTGGLQQGTASEGGREFNWTLSGRTWTEDSAMQVVTADVTFTAQGKNYDVKLSTLASLPGQTILNSTVNSTMNSTQ